MSSPIDINLEKLINKILVAKSQNNDRDYTHFHSSEFHACHRKLAYKYYEAKGICSPSEPAAKFIDPCLQRIFDNGHGVHFRLGKNLEKTGIVKGRWQCPSCSKTYGKKELLGVHPPQKCDCGGQKFRYQEVGFYDPETMIGGHVDAILDLRGVGGIPEDASEEESHLLVDFKSIRTEAFRKLVGPKDDHFTQVQTYLHLSGLRAGKLLYEDKNDQKFREFLVVRDEAYIQKIVKDGQALKNIVTSTNSKGQHALPPRAHKKDNARECVECAFRSHCWGLSKKKRKAHG
jgi:hypothetical protein